jgi:tetratricopeptide (TPR) repeat protein
MATVLQDFLETAPDGAARVLQALAAAESLTDDVAREIYELEPIRGVSADLFVRALHYADFIAPRNSEWHFVPEVRQELQSLGVASPEIVSSAHLALIKLGDEGDRSLAGSVIPGYLFTNAGKAYHRAALGMTGDALALYARASAGPLTGAQWLASKLADEQEARGALPAGSIETTFLRAMVIFREGRRQEAEPLFRQVAETDKPRIEVAIALNILGNLIGRRNPREAEAFFRRSIEIGEELENQHHIAQTLHSLANLIGRDQSRRDEAETLYRRSIEIDESLGNEHGVAQTLHSLANLIGRDQRRRDEAEKLYRRSIEILESFRDQHGVAQTLHSLANLVGRGQQRRDEAEKLLRRSIEIGESLGDRRGIAQRLRSLSFVVEHRSPKEAEQLLEQSLDLNRQARDRRGETLVRQSLQQLRGRYRL